ncbi:hypothetical protein [Marinobacter sp.]|jgi:hypothetical protein|uniref:hypothetical protein n=1 Tax=Marinobacter sp. TaxID=50741 RepID=UPI000C89378A|nr:hypothetical protein [Marinobacter sp.]MAK50647.1 hypothetical protein [Marinobacter sp.]|tara:strand:+ start:911 stop:1675 length:765 start_codon:yes stop_codon:yes gene_type:complete
MIDENKEVAPKATTDVVTFDDTLLSEGTGLEETTVEDFAIPFIRVLQPMSPQLNKASGSYVEGASAGDLYNTVTNSVYSGDKGIVLVPSAYIKKYIEWVPREKGGGLVNANHDISILSECRKDPESRRYYTKDGNEIVETAQFYVLVLDPEPQQAVIAFTSTQLSVARKWLTMMRMARVQNSQGQHVEAPMFAYTYRLTTTSQSNDKGTWNSFSISQEGQTSLADAQIAKTFMTAARSGEVEVKEEQLNDTVTL